MGSVPAPTQMPVSQSAQSPRMAPTAAPTPVPSIGCAANEHVYRLKMYDANGDGWQGASFTVSTSTTTTSAVVANGTLDDGASGSAWICLVDGCYLMNVGGGSPDRYGEISFELLDEVGGHFQDHEAPFNDAFCAEAGGIYAHPTTQPTARPSAVPTTPPPVDASFNTSNITSAYNDASDGASDDDALAGLDGLGAFVGILVAIVVAMAALAYLALRQKSADRTVVYATGSAHEP